MAIFAFSVPHVHAGTAKDHIKVHTIDTDGGIVLDSQVDMLLDTEAEVTVQTEVFTAQLVFTDLQFKISE